jgi:hypothetical protein
MSHLADVIPVPPRDSINTGLSPAIASTMLKHLGRPGKLTKDCSEPTGERILSHLRHGVDVGPFRVSGLDFAIRSLTEIFNEVKLARPDLFEEVRTAGMLCVRHRRHNPSLFSNHSWGTAIDLFFGEGVVDQGRPFTHRGILALYFFFHRHGWYWGAGFSGESVDSMHFEMAEETVLAIPR